MTHKVLGPSPSGISDSLPGRVNAIYMLRLNIGEFAGYKFCITDYSGCTFFKLTPIQLSCRKDFSRPCQLVEKLRVEVEGYLLVRLQNVRVNFDCFISVNELVCYRFTEKLSSAS